MNRDQAKEYVKNNLETYLNSITSKKGNMYICPLCKSGTGANKTPAGAVKGNRFSCFSCDNTNLDTIDLIAQVESLEAGSPEAFNRAYEIFNIEIDKDTQTRPQAPNEQQGQYTPTTHDAQDINYTQFFLDANKNIDKCDYLDKRGISKETQNKFKIGYVEDWKSPTAVKRAKENKTNEPPATQRIIIPTSKTSYIARTTNPSIKDYAKMKEGKVNLFNRRAIEQVDKPIFITEGEIDALSIIEIGAEAIGLGSTSNIKSLLKLIDEKASKDNVFIVLMDNDEKGQEASKELMELLGTKGTYSLQATLPNEYKDPNEYLVRNREGFKETVKELEVQAIKLLNADKEKEKEEYLSTSTAHHINSFLGDIAKSVNTPYYPTGFSNLDAILDGGLYEGLYIVGAISSLGKTTLILQIADQIARQGQDILVFSLEMARTELMSKSISRETLEQSSNPRNAKTSRGITTGTRYAGYNPEEKELIKQAVKSYGQYAKNIFIHEGIGDIGVKHIKDTVDKHIRITGNKPLIVIDYLQLLAPYNERATDKQNTDKAVMELKRITRDYKTPIIAISSFNRGNYDAPVSMSAFKESGAIEYSSDVLIGLQLRGAGGKDFNVDEAKSKDPRQIELKILKNRNGKTGVSVEFDYYPLFNCFMEV